MPSKHDESISKAAGLLFLCSFPREAEQALMDDAAVSLLVRFTDDDDDLCFVFVLTPSVLIMLTNTSYNTDPTLLVF